MPSTGPTFPAAPPLIDAAVVRAMEPSLLRYARSRVRREEDARELVQDTWEAAIAALPTFAGRSHFRTWLTGILRRKIVDRHRRRRNSVPYLEGLHDPPSDPPRDRLDDLKAVALVREELGQLPAQERAAVQMIDLEERTRDDVAQTLGMTRNHLRVTLHRGRSRLRQRLRAADHAVG